MQHTKITCISADNRSNMPNISLKKPISGDKSPSISFFRLHLGIFGPQIGFSGLEGHASQASLATLRPSRPSGLISLWPKAKWPFGAIGPWAKPIWTEGPVGPIPLVHSSGPSAHTRRPKVWVLPSPVPKLHLVVGRRPTPKLAWEFSPAEGRLRPA